MSDTIGNLLDQYHTAVMDMGIAIGRQHDHTDLGSAAETLRAQLDVELRRAGILPYLPTPVAAHVLLTEADAVLGACHHGVANGSPCPWCVMEHDTDEENARIAAAGTPRLAGVTDQEDGPAVAPGGTA